MRAESLGGLLPGEVAAAAGEQVDGTRADRGRGVDHGGQGVPRGLRVAGQVRPPANRWVDRLHGIVVALQQHWELGIEQLAVQDAQPRHAQRCPMLLAVRPVTRREGDVVHGQTLVCALMSRRGSRSRRRIAHGMAGIPRAAHRGLRRCRSAVGWSSGICRSRSPRLLAR